ncbi:GL19118 [Drosophila persimilis]|uniref:GL19118 n=1 Tax=Drosophila persimilis TaxID=7234 RepID=B4HCG2_DROPE|nr:GL19118 [Drosophila persimilis]
MVNVLSSLLVCGLVLVSAAQLKDGDVLQDYQRLKSLRPLGSSISVTVKMCSARSSSRAIFRIVDSKSNPNVISCLDGIRCMSLFCVVFDHEYIYSLISPNINTFNMISWVAESFSSFIIHGFFSVDSFFFIGGLLVATVALRSMDKSKGKLNVPLMYLHRIIRIVPILAIAILVYIKLTPIVSGGPYFKGGFHGTAAYEKGWFWTLLFVQNYATSNICLDHTWYWAVDMQLYIISPLLLIALYKWGKKAAAGIAVLVLLLSSCLFATMIVNKYSLLFKSKGKLNVPLMYLHRIIRIVPILAIAILVYIKLTPIVSGGPYFKGGFHGTAAYEKGWFWTLLFVQNYATSNIVSHRSTLMQKFWSDFGITIFISYLLYVVIEAPFGGLDNLLRSREKSVLKPQAPSEQKQSSVDVQQGQLNAGSNLVESDVPK